MKNTFRIKKDINKSKEGAWTVCLNSCAEQMSSYQFKRH